LSRKRPCRRRWLDPQGWLAARSGHLRGVLLNDQPLVAALHVGEAEPEELADGLTVLGLDVELVSAGAGREVAATVDADDRIVEDDFAARRKIVDLGREIWREAV